MTIRNCIKLTIEFQFICLSLYFSLYFVFYPGKFQRMKLFTVQVTKNVMEGYVYTVLRFCITCLAKQSVKIFRLFYSNKLLTNEQVYRIYENLFN